MAGTIVLVAENQELHAHLNRRLEDQEYGVLLKKDVPEALLYLRDPSCNASVVVFDVAMRRQQDFCALSEISTFRPHLQFILVADKPRNGWGDPFPVKDNLRILPKSVPQQELFQAVQEAAYVADTLIESAQAEEELQYDEQSGGNTAAFPTPFLMRVGMADVPVLLHGETGVGKEVMARRLCAYSPRAQKPFLKLNCAALPSELVESELFGYEKGAFTGAIIDKPGKFEIAQGGTILLDEIGDMDIRLQAKLLQVLQDGEIQPLGSRKTVKLNVRVLAATHRDLRRAIEQGTFREDLYYRLNVINIVIPPLRERRDEIMPLAESLLRRHLRPGMTEPVITEELKRLMMEYDWPGNVRELENLMRRFLVYQNASMLVSELTRAINDTKPRPILNVSKEYRAAAAAPERISSMDHLAEVSRQAETRLLLEALEATHWNRRQAAARVNLEYKAFLYKLQKFGIAEKKERAEVQHSSVQ
jgi:DNA-binding NtrC family response regulator